MTVDIVLPAKMVDVGAVLPRLTPVAAVTPVEDVRVVSSVLFDVRGGFFDEDNGIAESTDRAVGRWAEVEAAAGEGAGTEPDVVVGDEVMRRDLFRMDESSFVSLEVDLRPSRSTIRATIRNDLNGNGCLGALPKDVVVVVAGCCCCSTTENRLDDEPLTSSLSLLVRRRSSLWNLGNEDEGEGGGCDCDWDGDSVGVSDCNRDANERDACADLCVCD